MLLGSNANESLYIENDSKHVLTISMQIVKHRKDFTAVAIQYNVRRWLNPDALGTEEHSSFSSPIGMRPLWFTVPRSSE